MSVQYLKLYQVDEINVWPYEDVKAMTPIDRDARVLLPVALDGKSTYRCYLRHPDRFVSIAPIEVADAPWDGSAGFREISTYQLRGDPRIALQIEYVMFRSWKAADNANVQRLVNDIKNGTLTPLAFPSDLRPSRVIINADAESHPWHTLRLQGTPPPDKATSVFMVSEPSQYPYINNHTIPAGIDYECVTAAVVTYDLYTLLPTYDELLQRLARYCDWFDQSLGGTRRTGPRKRSKDE